MTQAEFSHISDYFTIIGTLLTLAGIVVALIQIFKTKNIVRAQQDAIEKTKEKLRGQFIDTDVIWLREKIESAITFLRNEKYDICEYSINQTKSNFTRILAMLDEDDMIHGYISNIVIDLAESSTILYKVNTQGDYTFSPIEIVSKLQNIIDTLDKYIGSQLFQIKENV